MKTTRTNTPWLAAAAAAIVSLSPLGVQAAHESNNKAMLGESGIVIVNYVKGKDTWNAAALVHDLPAGTYQLAVRFNAGGVVGEPQEVCLLTSDGTGPVACNESQFDLGGFHEALVLDMDGNIVLSGLFDRRGGNRVSG